MSQPWMFCDGTGGQEKHPPLPRRAVIKSATAMALAAWLGRSALHDAVFAAPPGDAGRPRDVLVTLFLRGGADGLSIVPPVGDDDYFRLRPTLALAASNNRTVLGEARTQALDDFFGLHPALSGLYPAYQEGQMAVVHAVGSGDHTRSHFEAMATLEYGMQDNKASGGGGWIARHLNVDPPRDASPLRAVAFASTLPDLLRGASTSTSVNSLEDFRLGAAPPSVPETLAKLYRTGDDVVSRAGRQTLSVLDTLKAIDPAHYRPQNGAAYPQTDLGAGFRQVACLLRANVGLEVACLDRGGWDTHVAQGTGVGWLALQLKDVGDSLAAFARDLGKDGMARVTVVVMTEFGRRAQENSGLGTDHGRASAALVLGGGINGGKVYARWPGLAAHQLEDGLDLKPTLALRDLLGEIVAKRLGGTARLAPIFPGTNPADWAGVARPA